MASRAQRLQRIRLQQHRERMQAIPESERVKAKREARQACLDQVELDKLEGREEGRIARQLYAQLQRDTTAPTAPQAPRRAQRMYRQWRGPRPADTYRGLRKIIQRGKHMALMLKAQRDAIGATRSEWDQHRRFLAQAKEAGRP